MIVLEVLLNLASLAVVVLAGWHVWYLLRVLEWFMALSDGTPDQEAPTFLPRKFR